uniref:C2H2-type domain-containing protein n=1 Tax=Timema poppense TaxID=170557 RepID=A0A7R9D0Z6_TIMPO|nr:unnamed protein product [Timema poppensis]
MEMFGEPRQIKVEPVVYYNSSNNEDGGCSSNSSPGKDELGILEVNKMDNLSRSKSQACKVCGKVLSSASSYYVHMKLHSGNKPYHCTACEASFCRKPYLEVHMRTHTGERPFQCELCLKRFTQKSSLNTHKRVHTGERPYSCDICNKKFAVKSYVTAHSKETHCCYKSIGLNNSSPVENYKEDTAPQQIFHEGLTLKRKKYLYDEIRAFCSPETADIVCPRPPESSTVDPEAREANAEWSHIAEKPLTCDQCSLTFSSKSQFALHIRSHATIASFECQVCGRAFVKDSYLIRHYNRVHREGVSAGYETACDLRGRSTLQTPHNATTQDTQHSTLPLRERMGNCLTSISKFMDNSVMDLFAL